MTVDFGWPAGRLIFRRGNFGGGSKLGKIVGLDLALAFENSIKGEYSGIMELFSCGRVSIISYSFVPWRVAMFYFWHWQNV